MNKPDAVPYIVFEETQARAEKRDKRLVVALVMTIVLLFVSNVLWLKAWMSYDYADTETETVTVDGGENGNAGYVRNGGSVINGASDSEANENADEN